MEELKIKLIKNDVFFLCITCLVLCIGLVILFSDNYKQTERLNEQKRLLIAQQEQINKLIINAKQNELNK